MKYYLDTEFLEGVQKKKLFGFSHGETKPTIDLISIGIVAEDGREYYAISKDFNLKEAWNRYDIIKGDSTMVKSIGDNQYEIKNYWIRNNVLKPIFFELAWEDFHLTHFKDTWLSDDKELAKKDFIVEGLADNFKWFKKLLNKYGKTNKEIAKEIKDFTHYWNDLNSVKIHTTKQPITIEFYAYYADYDWVVFCWLFGKMIDLPKGFSMYCRDLKQTLDDKAYTMTWNTIDTAEQKYKDCKEWIEDIKKHPNYPKQENEHNALDDARWNKKLHEFITTL